MKIASILVSLMLISASVFAMGYRPAKQTPQVQICVMEKRIQRNIDTINSCLTRFDAVACGETTKALLAANSFGEQSIEYMKTLDPSKVYPIQNNPKVGKHWDGAPTPNDVCLV